MTGEIVGIVVFSVFMFGLVGVLVGNLFVALYRERKLRNARSRAPGGRPADD
jgi:hypothetical protein